ncbi:uncharacterized protein LOC124200920 isoform X4 [Daphnia pulex]|uniref:uncharacterized protein LOC124200920 isoform X3 n=1 Tax=Daphnia pulex TaxID=6669 RepID=UPI001EDDC4FA|nr:uncharacterized protein LOC124200920 isoform X3 [Daphnia pulex]XP_046453256.1 uncharacterized protein LOC124200920 isoform X4 [Daphnia pulex]
MASLKLNRRLKNLSMCVKKLKKTTLEDNQAEGVLGQIPSSSVEVCPNSPILACDYCGKTFTSIFSLSSHRISHYRMPKGYGLSREKNICYCQPPTHIATCKNFRK